MTVAYDWKYPPSSAKILSWLGTVVPLDDCMFCTFMALFLPYVFFAIIGGYVVSGLNQNLTHLLRSSHPLPFPYPLPEHRACPIPADRRGSDPSKESCTGPAIFLPFRLFLVVSFLHLPFKLSDCLTFGHIHICPGYEIPSDYIRHHPVPVYVFCCCH